ncbi:Clan SC, family S33, methylesterase-like serine peptidase [Trichomonas vaginalis G3]|uniref:Clan SC, family S33, methylesterase-like serine peptidase n=1 Tax=Trichomonas vaginalis (strain ATCC PRA-98 / G3) TaxID=412133 RepID=A2EII2_TRIV3|nr:Clan SC, family S33, methylesterase-like serine peptidase [Trichomonas vaginalis G3]EAY07503.1 Clan SC, family S33, methylesterase-like serine peptidase [Trichomonas vaginalis G3]KAI5550544.1 Clan SC, family S33, methylesterase-like serine peptidase [Trichomonas vaginalis G3]|eukprot:XP_001319726.1 Clan SC, family S33, methylesterase-like serine peptidase [Trichomonas vaginalis G3]
MEIFESNIVTLGNQLQKIYLEGKNKSNPVMIMLHGGPLMPFVYCSAYRGLYEDLRSNYTLIWWDEYGSGKNYVDHSLLDNFTVDDWVTMTIDLYNWTIQKFPNCKIVINGYSFGTFLATRAFRLISKDPNHKISGVINMGPILNMKNASLRYENTLMPVISQDKKEKIEELRNGSYIKYQNYLEALAEKYLNCQIYNKKDAHNSMMKIWISRLLFSPDYTLTDTIHYITVKLHSDNYYNVMWESFGNLDMTEDYKSLTVPTLFLQGSEELYVSKEQLDPLLAGKQNIFYHTLEKSAHCPTTEAWNQITKLVCEFKQNI